MPEHERLGTDRTDHPGARLDQLDASWYGTASIATWEALASGAEFELSPRIDGQRLRSGGASLVVEQAGRTLAVFIDYHESGGADDEVPGDGSDDVETHWHLRIREASSGTAPSDVLDFTKRVGGATAFFGRVAGGWPTTPPVKVRCSAAFSVDATAYKLRKFARDAHKKVRLRDDGAGYRLASAGRIWRVLDKDGGHGGHITVSTEPKKVASGKFLALSWSGKVELQTMANFVQDLEDRAWRNASLALKAVP